MEVLEERIKNWLRVDSNYGYGSGSGYGYGYGYGDGSGYGSGSGYGYGSGSGYGYGYGYGSGSGYGYGYGYGDGSGYGSGSGSGYGSGSGIKSINNHIIYMIDEVPTIIEHLNKDIAKGFICNKDLTFEPCYIVKGHNQFAHGETIKKAMKSLEEKIFEDLDSEEAIALFREKFAKDKKYKGTTFYQWHHNLTGSCEMGRNNFVKNHELNLNKLYSVKEFIELTENDYGGEIIKQLKEYYNLEE